ncbi:MAG: tyrosine-protein phosphatase [Firmicutes bacterium]|nr:tyrosine-protein phosphatase [Bacillota bacterium]
MINNLRDLGGIKTRDGKRIKKGLFIRSARLSFMNEADIELLHSLDVRKIYDLRLPREARRSPDIIAPGIEYISWPFQDENNLGENDVFAHLKARVMAAPNDDERIKLIPDLRTFYVYMYEDEYSRTRLKNLALEILGNREGSVLFHCTSGKDRTGMLTAVILGMLGVSREDIMADYMQSLDFSKLEAQGFYDNVKAQGGSDRFAGAMYNMYVLHEINMRVFLSGLDTKSDFFRIDEEQLAEIRAYALEQA